MLTKNQKIQLTIEDVGNDGEGIGRYEGMVIFVKDTCPGDEILAVVTKVKKQMAYGKMLQLLKPSGDRVQPACPMAATCGGCTLQHVTYQKQLEFKWNKVKNCLSRIGGVEEVATIMEPPIGMEQPYHYRNKSQFPVGVDKNGHVITGFYAGRTHSIIPVTSCAIQTEAADEILSIVRTFLEEYHIPIYQEEQHKGLVRHILIRIGFTSGQKMVCLILNGKKLPNSDVLVERLTKINGMTSIIMNINQEKTNRIMGDTCHTLWGKDVIEDWIGDVKFEISPLSFYQVNPVQTKVLYQKALEYANLSGKEIVWDLYCGIGTISLFLAKQAKEVYGVEIIPQAVKNAKKNAENNGITNATFFAGKAEEVVPELYQRDEIKADVVVVDPPRKGCDDVLLNTIVEMKPERIVYVSCDPATLARDVKVLSSKGYEVKKVAVVDQFCHSGHVETVVLMSRGAVRPVDERFARTGAEA